MHRLLTSILLCFAAQVGAAPCAGTAAPLATHDRACGGFIRTATAGAPVVRTAAADDAVIKRGGPDAVIRRTAADLQDAPPLRRASTAASQRKAEPADGDEHRRAGPAMLIAAIALMSAIALRRVGASGE